MIQPTIHGTEKILGSVFDLDANVLSQREQECNTNPIFCLAGETRVRGNLILVA